MEAAAAPATKETSTIASVMPGLMTAAGGPTTREPRSTPEISQKQTKLIFEAVRGELERMLERNPELMQALMSGATPADAHATAARAITHAVVGPASAGAAAAILGTGTQQADTPDVVMLDERSDWRPPAGPDHGPQWGEYERAPAAEEPRSRPSWRPSKEPEADLADHLFRTDQRQGKGPNHLAEPAAMVHAGMWPAMPLMSAPSMLDSFSTALPADAHKGPRSYARELMPRPPSGWPPVYRNSPRSPFRGLPITRVSHILAQPKDTTIIFNIWGAPGAKAKPVDELYDFVKQLFTSFLGSSDGCQLIPPQAEWGKNIAPNALNAPALWGVTNLVPAHAKALIDQHCLATPDGAVLCYRPGLENPRFLMRVGNFVSKDRDLIRQMMAELFLRPMMRTRITDLLAQNPNYAGTDPNQAYARFLSTIEVRISEIRNPATGRSDAVATLYCDPPTLNPDRWLKWDDELRALKIEHPQFLNSGTVLPPIRCAGCHSVDHYIDQCAWPELPDWPVPLPGMTTNDDTNWYAYQTLPQTPGSRASSSRRAGPPGYGRGRGGFTYGTNADAPEQMRGFGRGRGRGRYMG